MPGVQKIDISSSTIFRTILLLFAFWFLYLIRDILIILVGAIVVAAAIEPLANRLQRYRMPRALSVILVYIGALVLLAASVTILVPVLAEQTVQLAQQLPHAVAVIQSWVGETFLLSSGTVVHQLQSALAQFGNELGTVGLNVVQQTSTVFSGLVSVLLVFVIALYLVMEKNALGKFFHIVVPQEHHAYVDQAISRVHYKIGRWVLGQVTLAVIMGVAAASGLWLLGVPYALALGLLVGIFELVPVIGPILASIPGVIIAFTQSWWLGLAVLVFYIFIQQAESHILIPHVMSRATGLNPLVTLLAVLLGARLLGVAGIILAVPVATIMDVLLSDLFGKKPLEGNTSPGSYP